jgi:hypothetical protein
MSTPEVQEIEEVDQSTPMRDVVAGYLAAAAIFAGIACVFFVPLRIGPPAMAIALVAAGIGGGQKRLAAWAVGVATLGWLIGMIVAVTLSRDVF